MDWGKRMPLKHVNAERRSCEMCLEEKVERKLCEILLERKV